MADLNSTITVAPERRPCYVDGKKAMFHKWVDRSEIVPPSMMVGGHGGGQIRECFGLVEMEDGYVTEVFPSKIVFADGGDFDSTPFRAPKDG